MDLEVDQKKTLDRGQRRWVCEWWGGGAPRSRELCYKMGNNFVIFFFFFFQSIGTDLSFCDFTEASLDCAKERDELPLSFTEAC